MTKGTEIIGTFNNEGKQPVDEIKIMAAAFIDMVHAHGQNGRHNAIATTHIETAAMFAVKSIFTPETPR